MTYLMIRNSGHVETNAMSLIGASTKRDDPSKIGQFGSGFGLALAVLLRNDVRFHIYSGTRAISITTQPELFRGQEFQCIVVDGKTTSLTTGASPDWENWEAVREMIANAIDEPDTNIVKGVKNIENLEGYTTIYINEDDIADVMVNWDMYFYPPNPDNTVHVGDYGTIMLHPKPTHIKHGERPAPVYREGLRCTTMRLYPPSLFAYDVSKEHTTIEENRLVYHWSLYSYVIPRILAECTSEDVIRAILPYLSAEYTLESSILIDSDPPRFSDTWKEVLDEFRVLPASMEGKRITQLFNEKPRLFVEDGLYTRWARSDVIKGSIKATNKDQLFTYVPFEPELRNRVSTALSQLNRVGIHVGHTIRSVEFADEGIMGAYLDNEILLNCACDGLDTTDGVFKTLLEEHIHATTGARDHTYEMQHAYLNTVLRIATSMEENNYSLEANNQSGSASEDQASTY